jgi:hypothetical protein
MICPKASFPDRVGEGAFVLLRIGRERSTDRFLANILFETIRNDNID